MEGQPAKRRRVYSVEPKKVEEAVFTRNYLYYLVPALMKIKELRSSKEHISSQCETFFENVVKYEVDKAMVLSAQGFAWSDALKVKLQRDHVNVAAAARSTSILENEMVPFPLDYFSSNSSPSSKSEAEVLVSKSKYKDTFLVEKDLAGEKENIEEDDQVIFNRQLRSFKKLIPGGEEMGNEQMVAELESYISCLQMQVNILQCLVETP